MSVGVSPDLPHLEDLPVTREWGLRIAKIPVELIFRGYWRVRVSGREHIPRHGPVILAANHIGYLDGPLLVAVTHRLAFALAKEELFVGGLGHFLSHAGQISINRQTIDRRAISRCIQILRANKVLAVFPEGRRGGGEVASARGGAAYLAMVTGAPIVPVAILGTREPGQDRNQIPRWRAPMRVVYGEPIRLPRSPWPRRKALVAEYTEEVRTQLAAHVRQAQVETGIPLPGPPKPRPVRAVQREKPSEADGSTGPGPAWDQPRTGEGT